MNQLTANWLRHNLQPYPERDRVFADVDAVLARHPTLRPKTDVYTYDDGRTQLLLCIHGLLPIAFRNASYHIPVALWLTRDYPREPPIAYVVPTTDMLVKPGPHMDVSGRANIPYLAQWVRKPEGCSLPLLIEALQAHFSQDPPVYAKPKSPPPPANDYAIRPPPPVPPTSASSSTPPHPSAAPSPHPDRPALPPKPIASLPAPAPNPYIPHPNGAPILTRSPASQPTPPPVPPHPPLAHPGPALPMHSPTAPAYLRSPSYPTSPPPGPVFRYTQPPPPPAPPAAAPVLSPVPLSPPPPPALPPPNLLDTDDTAPAPAPPPPADAPPRPPNPELQRLQHVARAKLAAELASLAHAHALDAERLRAHQADLLAGGPAVRDEAARLRAVRDVCAGAAARYRGVVAEGEQALGAMRRKGEVSVDELVCGMSIVHNQLVDLVAEDNAIEDTVYHLHRALNAGRTDLDRFLRTTRVLAEEQFMKRALAEKIQHGLGWA